MTIRSTVLWFQQAIPEPNNIDFQVQMGVHAEESRETLEELLGLDNETIRILEQAKGALEKLANHLKTSPKVVVVLPPEKRIKFLDGLCDTIVTSVGPAHCAGMDIIGAMTEVNASNWSKFVDGKPIFNENRKVMKGPSYFKPDLSKFV